MKLRLFIALALIPQILIVNYLKSNPSIVDDYYFGFIYNEVFKINSFIFSKTSIPVGELLYLIILISFIYLVFKLFSFKLKHFINLIAFISIVHFFFYSLFNSIIDTIIYLWRIQWSCVVQYTFCVNIFWHFNIINTYFLYDFNLLFFSL